MKMMASHLQAAMCLCPLAQRSTRCPSCYFSLFGMYGSTLARTFSMSALFNLGTTIFNHGLVWNTASKKSDTNQAPKSINTKRLAKMQPVVLPS